MNHPTSLTLENVRCFAGPETGQIPRVTLLVGENSTGKSTFLGCYRAFATLTGFDQLWDRNYFDQEPFSLGAFDTIARNGSEEFAVKSTFERHCHESVRLAYRDGGHPYPEEHEISIRPAEASSSFGIERIPGRREVWRVEGPGFRFEIDQADVSWRQLTTWLSLGVRVGHLPFHGEVTELRRRLNGISAERQSAFARMANYLIGLPLPKEPVEVGALDPRPPERRRRYRGLAYPVDDSPLAERVADIGRRIGLFSGIKASPRGADGMREILIEMPDGWRNIVDVGYGIHSVLSVLFQMCVRGDDSTFLLQQPEVHIHPTAQAALATVMAKSGQHFLIETHSEHLIDRFRIDVMRGNMEPEDLQILYFEKASDGKSSKIHSIGVDKDGNLCGVPRGYREFFLKESRRLLFARRGES